MGLALAYKCMTLTKIEPFPLKDLTAIGAGLNRPECVLAAPDGSLYTGDWSVGIARVAPDGTTGSAVAARPVVLARWR